jgi:hypothetical protein
MTDATTRRPARLWLISSASMRWAINDDVTDFEPGASRLPQDAAVVDGKARAAMALEVLGLSGRPPTTQQMRVLTAGDSP